MTMSLEDRIEAAAFETFGVRWHELSEKEREVRRQNDVVPVLRAAFPELFASPAEAWLAPMEATRDMLAARNKVMLTGSWGDNPNDDERRRYEAMRDVHLNPKG